MLWRGHRDLEELQGSTKYRTASCRKFTVKTHVVIFFYNSGLGEFSRKKMIPLWIDVPFLVEGRLIFYSS